MVSDPRFNIQILTFINFRNFIAVSDEILVSQTPPPTPNDANQQHEEIRERLHCK